MTRSAVVHGKRLGIASCADLFGMDPLGQGRDFLFEQGALVELSGETFLVFRRSDDDTRVRLLQGVTGGWFDRTQIADGLFPRIVFSRGLMGELVPFVERSSCGVSAE